MQSREMLDIQHKLEALLTSGVKDNRRPTLSKTYESNIKGLYIIGDLAGAPVIKLAMAQGVEVINTIVALPDMKTRNDILDVAIIGAGAAGLNAALAAQDMGLTHHVLEKGKIANTIENFPEGKWIYAEPDTTAPKGKLWLDGATKEDLIARWHQIITENKLNIQTETSLTKITKQSDGSFILSTDTQEFQARKIVLASGQRGNPRKLNITGEEQEPVYHQLYSPRQYHDEDILIVGGGNSAIEAALTLSEQNRVTLSYRKNEFARLFKENQNQIDQAIAQNRVKVIFNSQVKSFGKGQATLAINDQEQTVKTDHAFVLIGAELPVKFLKSLGIKLENEWEGSLLGATILTAILFIALWFAGGQAFASGQTLGALASVGSLIGLIAWAFRGNRWCWLGFSFFLWYSVYGIKYGQGEEFWPYRDWGYTLISFMDRPWSFWYTVLYTGLMTAFGVRAMKRWGFDHNDRMQIWRFTSLIAFQWIFFFIIPELLFQWAIQYQWVGQQLAADPQFADQAWRTYGIVYAWPLFFYTFFYDPHTIWVIWGVALTFVIIPILVLFQGKRYCSWICGCGGLAETFGDQWRHLAPKGKASIQWEKMNGWILILAVVVTLLILSKDTIALFREPANFTMQFYRVIADVWLVGILPVTLYPFLGGKIWCRYWCPLAKMMQIFSKAYTKLGLSRFHIVANEKCIACNECSRNCQVGIDVMQYALKQEPLNNETSSCIGCGICVTVCPMDTLSYSPDGKRPLHKIS